MNAQRFEDDLPDGCPPAEAVSAGGQFYATHRSLPPDADDFRTAAGRGAFPGGDDCQRHGNSVMADLADARHLCRLYPDVHRHVSRAALAATDGMLSANPTRCFPSHHTLWRFAGVTMHGLFAEVV